MLWVIDLILVKFFLLTFVASFETAFFMFVQSQSQDSVDLTL